MGFIADAVNDVVHGVTQAVTAVVSAVVDAVAAAVRAIVQIGSQIFSAVSDVVSKVVGAFDVSTLLLLAALVVPVFLGAAVYFTSFARVVTMVSSMGSAFQSFMGVIHFKTLLMMHQIAVLVSAE